MVWSVAHRLIHSQLRKGLFAIGERPIVFYFTDCDLSRRGFVKHINSVLRNILV